MILQSALNNGLHFLKRCRFSALQKLLKSIDVQKPVDIDREIDEFLKSNESFVNQKAKVEVKESDTQSQQIDPHAEAIAKMVKQEMSRPFVRRKSPYELGQKSQFH